jgi:hypothetical protein
VAIELLRVEKDATTKGGVYMGFLETTTWEDERESHPADVASVVGRVVKVPQKLYYNEDDPHNSMPWETDMQLEIGMVIFFNFIESLNAHEIEIGTKVIRIIPYQDCYVAKDKEKVICLNGYVLLEQVPVPKQSKYDLVDHGVYEDRGIVRYFGEPNRAYIEKKYSDDINIKEGDMAYLRPGYRPFALERQKYFSVFEGDKLFWCLQRRRIIMAI